MACNICIMSNIIRDYDEVRHLHSDSSIDIS